MAGRKPLYRDLMTWRAIKNALAGLLAGLAGGVLLGALIVIWGVTLFTLATGTDDWEHVVVYVGIVLLIMALTPWLVHGLSAMQRSRLRATLGAEIAAPVRPLGRTWHQLGYHLLAVPVGLAGGLLAVLFPVAPWLAGGSPGPTRAWPGRCSGPAAARAWPSGSSRWPAAAPTWSPPPTPNAAGSNATCTTARSSGWCRWP